MLIDDGDVITQTREPQKVRLRRRQSNPDCHRVSRGNGCMALAVFSPPEGAP